MIPLCDYLPDVGPMRAGPYDENGLATPMKELPSDGRVHKFAVNRMPPLDSIKLQDPSLRRVRAAEPTSADVRTSQTPSHARIT